MTDWIPCTERLPAPGVDVLTLNASTRRVSVHHLLPDASCGWYPGGWDIGFTSHWMPIPEPPKENPK